MNNPREDGGSEKSRNFSEFGTEWEIGSPCDERKGAFAVPHKFFNWVWIEVACFRSCVLSQLRAFAVACFRSRCDDPNVTICSAERAPQKKTAKVTSSHEEGWQRCKSDPYVAPLGGRV